MELDFGKKIGSSYRFFSSFVFFLFLSVPVVFLSFFYNFCSFVKREAPVNSNGARRRRKDRNGTSKGTPFWSTFAHCWARIFNVFFISRRNHFFAQSEAF